MKQAGRLAESTYPVKHVRHIETQIDGIFISLYVGA